MPVAAGWGGSPSEGPSECHHEPPGLVRVRVAPTAAGRGEAAVGRQEPAQAAPVSYTHLRAHETSAHL
eukprot:13127501-Alexandrium_andersonii.AAC.1